MCKQGVGGIFLQQLKAMRLNEIITPPNIDKTISSLCPVCLKIVDAHVFQEGGAVKIDKRCSDHGDLKMCIGLMLRFIEGSCVSGPLVQA
jgi:hypothetical protein